MLYIKLYIFFLNFQENKRNEKYVFGKHVSTDAAFLFFPIILSDL